jgi:hypothetical protein
MVLFMFAFELMLMERFGGDKRIEDPAISCRPSNARRMMAEPRHNARKLPALGQVYVLLEV